MSSYRRTPADNAQLALLLEVAGTPKPGNVDRKRDYPDLHFEHFLAGAVGAYEGLTAAATGVRTGAAFEQAVAGMSNQRGGNTQFGALLLLVPLVGAAMLGNLSQSGATRVVESTTIDDAADFYRSFEYVDVAVDDPPAGLEPLDVRRGADAIPTIEERGITLYEIMEHSAGVDGIAREWVEGFPRTFEAAAWLREGEGPVTTRAAETYLRLLADRVDTFVVTRHDAETGQEVTDRAGAALAGEEDPDDLAEELVGRGINPGTTADITAGALFVALERGLTI